jgi:hypothetical protein
VVNSYPKFGSPIFVNSWFRANPPHAAWFRYPFWEVMIWVERERIYEYSLKGKNWNLGFVWS